ncbi:MAG TPA: PH domain-containing protein [Symbiobacteriaceae bacterium]
MGLFDALMGNASEVSAAEAQREFEKILAEGETVEKAYRLIRDMFLFTNRRLILVDRQGLTGKKIEYHSIPYRSIVHFSIETAGHFDLDAELKIWVTGQPEPIQKQFNRSLNIYELQRVLARYVLR